MGPRARAGRKVSAPTTRTVPIRMTTKVGPLAGKLASLGGRIFFLARLPGQGQDGQDHQEAADEHGQGQGQVVGDRVAVQSGEGAAVVSRSRREGVQDLAQPVRPGIGRSGQAPPADRGPGGEAEDAEDRDEHGQDGDLDVIGLDLLAHVFRGPSDHQAGEEDGQDDEDEHPVEPRADAAEDHFADLDVEERDQAARAG